MNYELLYLAVLALPVVFYMVKHQKRQSTNQKVLHEAVQAGLNEPASMHPVIDPVKCIGSGSCVKVCPEKALGMVNGKAVLINASACIGHGACMAACPFDAIALVFGTEKRGMDVPPLSAQFESSVPGIFVAGELGGMGLIRKAAEQGRQAVDAIHARIEAQRGKVQTSSDGEVLDLVIVGCGPAGLSAGLAAQAHNLNFRLVEQEDALGGTVYHYPRNKVTMTAPVDLAIVGKMNFGEVQKEALLAFWQDVVQKTSLPIHFGESLIAVDGQPDASFVVTTSRGSWRSRFVLLAIGRRGSPRKLEVPGEESANVVYRLADPAQYLGQRVLVVGGGDSALEAAIALAAQPQTRVTLSYRSEAFSRVKGKNREQLKALEAKKRLRVLMSSTVSRINDGEVVLHVDGQDRPLKNDAVIVCVGGTAPTGMLQAMGIVFVTKHGTA